MAWQVWVVATVLVWGLWGFLSSMGVRSNSWQQLVVWGIPAAAVFGAGLWAWSGDQASFDPRALLWGSAIQIAGLTGVVFFYQALKTQQASLVVPVSAAYPAVTVLLAVVAGGERLRPLQLLGVALVIVGTVAVSASSTGSG